MFLTKIINLFWGKKQVASSQNHQDIPENLSADEMQERYGRVAPMPPAILKLADDYMAGKIDVDFETMTIKKKILPKSAERDHVHATKNK